MAGGLADLDTGFPDRGGGTEKQLAAVYDYLVMLLENLRYILRNLSPENFNEKETLDWIGRNIQANTIVSNTVITNELYADYGAIADLVVDELRTDYQKAARYFAGNTAAIDFLHIYDECIDFRTGTVKRENGVPLTEQLHHGSRYFWWREGRTQMTSLEDTGDPVIVYQYDELLKGTLRFEDYTSGGVTTKVPTFVLGAGYGNALDPAKGRGFLRKGTNSFDVWLKTSDGKRNGVFMNDDGFTDVTHRRASVDVDTARSVITVTPEGTAAGQICIAYTEDADGNLTLLWPDGAAFTVSVT